MSDNIYSKFNVDVTKLTRDYLKYPLQKIKKYNNSNKPYKEYEKINKDDLYYLYITCHLSTTLLEKYFFHIKSNILSKQIKKYNFLKDRKQIELDRKHTNKIIYGVENVMQMDYVKEKMFKTNLKKYGHKSSMENDNVLKLRINNNLKKYGVENVMQVKEIHEKMTNTMIKKYGCSNIYAANKSKEEQKCFNMLKEKFPDAIQHYYDKERYPYNCDMYIPSKDIFIEYQGYAGGHNKKPYMDTEEDRLELIELIIESNKHPFNKRIINAWGCMDRIKRDKAKESNIILLEFFNVKEFKKWLKEQ